MVTRNKPPEQIVDLSAEPPVRGFLHVPAQPTGHSLVLTHGAGANCESKFLVSLASEFAHAGFMVLRFDLPFRQQRPFGPPFAATIALDRQGIKRALDLLRQKTQGPIFAGGHSYGGRQASILLSEQPEVADGLLLLSYPLHSPRPPKQFRTAHLPALTRPVLFVHGTRDPFGSPEEMRLALSLIPAPHELLEIEEAGHELLKKKDNSNLPSRVVQRFQEFFQDRAGASA
jgi:predicted alpha/beta-hydrolase family hydrolase